MGEGKKEEREMMKRGEGRNRWTKRMREKKRRQGRKVKSLEVAYTERGKLPKKKEAKKRRAYSVESALPFVFLS